MSALALSASCASPRIGPPAATAMSVLSWRELTARRAAWDRLAAEADFPTPYFTAHVMGAHAAAGLLGRVDAVAVTRGERMLALLPYRARGTWLGGARLANVAWMSPYTTSANPLVSREEIGMALPLLLDGLEAAPGDMWLLPRLTLDGAVGLALRSEVERRGWPSAVIDPFERAVLEARADHGEFMATLEPGRRKDLRRRRRRLDELGTVAHLSAEGGPGLAEGIAAFLSLELAGWKGTAGTALAARPATATLARALFGAASGAVVPRSDLLTVDGRAVAASLSLCCGSTAYLLKTAYDETLSRLAPGILLEEEIVRSLHETRFVRRLDSAAVAGNHLEALYPDRERVGDLLIATGPVPAETFARIVAGERRRRAWLAAGKTLYRRVRERGLKGLRRA